MKDPKEIKYETGEYDEEGNPIYITEAEFREHGIITTQENEDLDENGKVIKVESKPVVKRKKRLSLFRLFTAPLVGLFTLFLTLPFLGGLGVLFYVGIAHCQTGSVIEGIVICIITGGVILAILGFAILMGYSQFKGRIRRSINVSHSDKKESDGIEGTYETFGYTRPNGTKVTHVFKKDD